MSNSMIQTMDEQILTKRRNLLATLIECREPKVETLTPEEAAAYVRARSDAAPPTPELRKSIAELARFDKLNPKQCK